MKQGYTLEPSPLKPLFYKSGQELRRERRKSERKLRWKRYLDEEKKLNQKREKNER